MTQVATGIQLRAARSALGWSREELAQRSGVSVRTIVRHEESAGVPLSRAGNLAALIRALEAAGIEFLAGDTGAPPGLRFHMSPEGP